MSMANEIKFICGLSNWEKYISVFLMPLAEGPNGIKTHLPKAIEYCLNHPEFTLCLCVGTTVVRALETAQGKPISTLGMKLMKKAYVKAIESNYRFYGFGDSTLII